MRRFNISLYYLLFEYFFFSQKNKHYSISVNYATMSTFVTTVVSVYNCILIRENKVFAKNILYILTKLY